jgi:hypothetical protein
MGLSASYPLWKPWAVWQYINPSFGITTEEDVVEETQEVAGKEVTVRSLIREKLGDSGFVIEAKAGEPIVVINATGASLEIPDESIPIQATGIVRQMSVAEIESQYNLDLDENLYADYENEPVLVAQSLALAPTPEVLAEFPAEYFEGTVAVEGRLKAIDGETPNAFALYDDDWADRWGVLVIAVEEDLKEQGTPIETEENVTVTGVTRQFSPELLAESGIEWDAERIQEFEERYTNRPVIVAEAVYPAAVPPAPGS